MCGYAPIAAAASNVLRVWAHNDEHHPLIIHMWLQLRDTRNRRATEERKKTPSTIQLRTNHTYIFCRRRPEILRPLLIWPRNLLNVNQRRAGGLQPRVGKLHSVYNIIRLIPLRAGAGFGIEKQKSPGNHQTISSLFISVTAFPAQKERERKVWLGVHRNTVPMLFRLCSRISSFSYSHYLQGCCDAIWVTTVSTLSQMTTIGIKQRDFIIVRKCRLSAAVLWKISTNEKRSGEQFFSFLERNEQSRFPPSPFQLELE